MTIYRAGQEVEDIYRSGAEVDVYRYGHPEHVAANLPQISSFAPFPATRLATLEAAPIEWRGVVTGQTSLEVIQDGTVVSRTLPYTQRAFVVGEDAHATLRATNADGSVEAVGVFRLTAVPTLTFGAPSYSTSRGIRTAIVDLTVTARPFLVTGLSATGVAAPTDHALQRLFDYNTSHPPGPIPRATGQWDTTTRTRTLRLTRAGVTTPDPQSLTVTMNNGIATVSAQVTISW